ncbi:hypothetical protein J2755_001692 [Methanohalophilus levihalophilus]|uniref:hypothetical protein n=1 Tax=Methanohalophilus levihalophilus TaxID=1431282 RepID=UPI001AE91E63|nr:hypothetical protein [Methanohalophilus levihalophilus]MBP2030744.1 hypothetical protein [Methanohalophilus levihalophilus]
MGELQEIHDSILFHVGLFISGIVAGIAVFGIEMEFFVGSMIIEALSNSLPASDTTNLAISNYYSMIFLLTIGGIIQGILIGFLDKISFSFGYICGVLFMVTILGGVLWSVAPSVVIGMVVAFIAVLIGIYLRILMKNKTEHNYGDHYW